MNQYEIYIIIYIILYNIYNIIYIYVVYEPLLCQVAFNVEPSEDEGDKSEPVLWTEVDFSCRGQNLGRRQMFFYLKNKLSTKNNTTNNKNNKTIQQT